jgi:hypothetical protein
VSVACVIIFSSQLTFGQLKKGEGKREKGGVHTEETGFKQLVLCNVKLLLHVL